MINIIGNQESSDKSLSDETLVLGRVERDAAKRRVRKRNHNKKRSNKKSKNRKVKSKRRNKSKKTPKRGRKQGRRNKSVRCSRQTGQTVQVVSITFEVRKQVLTTALVCSTLAPSWTMRATSWATLRDRRRG